MGHVKVKKRDLMYAGTVIDVYKDVVVLPGGGFETWDYVEHRTGAAAVVPVVEKDKLLLVKQYRPSLKRYTWELPAGGRSPEEDFEATAKRELLEETGYDSNEFTHLMTLQTTPGYCNEKIEIYLASDCYRVSEQSLDEAEDIEIKEWDVEVLLEMIYSGKLQDAKTVAGVTAYRSFSTSWAL
ncbi:MAG: NUDIX hydrolase [Lachnospiraceae bacterium]|nr:NUDIX hydrolase [Lachnospiraceae bacterium]